MAQLPHPFLHSAATSQHKSYISQIMTAVLCLCWSLPLLLSAATGSVTAREERDFPCKLILPRPKHFCDPAGMWKSDENASSICMLLKGPFGGSCAINVEETVLLGGGMQGYCHIPFHPLQVEMQYCSLEGNDFHSTVLNFWYWLARLTYKRLNWGGKKRTQNEGSM